MTDSIGSYIAEAQSVHTGPGSQTNIYLAATSERLGMRGKDPRAVAEADRALLYQRFLAPPRFGQARTLLREHGFVLLGGKPGSGRRAAALMLLHELPDTGGSFHELPDTTDDDQAGALETNSVGDGDRLLLDLSDSDETRYTAVQDDLSAFLTMVAQRRASLVIVLPHHLGYLQRPGLRPVTVELGRPRAHALLMRYLRLDGIHPSLAELSSPDLDAHMSHAPMSDLAHLADRIRRARDDTGPTGTFAQWCAQSLAALTDHGPEAARFIASLSNGRQRALTLALAMFHGSAPDTVFDATGILLEVLGHPKDDRPRLEHTDLTSEFEAIEAGTGADDQVRFSTLGYDQAVRTHFWTYLPDLRPMYCTWVQRCVQQQALSPQESDALITRFAEQCLRTGRPEDLWRLAERWTERGQLERLLPDAAQALAEGLRHDRHGRAFRQKIYGWSILPSLPKGLKQALVLVCSDVMAVRNPDQALVRLHHLARRESGAGKRPALDALLALAGGDGRLFRLLLDRLAPGRWPADSRIFLALADLASRTRALFVSVTVRDRLVSGWAAVLLHRPHQEWAEHIQHWLTAACATESHRESLLDVLVDGAAQHPGVIGRMYATSQLWAHASPTEQAARGELADLFRQKVDTAQSIEIPTTNM